MFEHPIAPQNLIFSIHKSYQIMPPTLILIRHAQALHNATSDWV
jgi:hypothetical protein